jgi:hypothetical protein
LRQIGKLVPFAFLAILCLASFVFAEDSLRISKIYIHSKDVFEDAVVHTSAEESVYRFGNWFHVNTREAVIRARLPFNEGSTISQSEMLEAEKNLRSLSYISDAKIEARQDSLGNTNLYVETSDNWTFTPMITLGKPGEKWLWGIGLLESNLLGLGHSIGFFYEQREERDQKYLLYKSNDFIIPYHSFNFIWSENSDGFDRSLKLAYPFITRSRNQWAYKAEMLWSKRDEYFYESINPKNPIPIDSIKGLSEDSLSLWLSRSFGGASFKTYFGMGYDYHEIGNDEWLDSRIGFSFAMSRIRLDKKYNLHKVKWAEDVERGYHIKSTIAKNFKDLGAISDDWYFEHNISLSLGAGGHNFYARGKNSFYYNSDIIRDMNSILFGEYIFKPSLEWASVLDARINSWQKTSYKRQLYLDGNNIFPGSPSYYLAGENTFAFRAEQRYFPNFEIFTLVPSFAAFLTAGQATERLHAFEPRELLYMAGIGLRTTKSKDVQGIVNHVNFSWPLNGELRKGFPLRFSFVGKVEL